MFLSLLLATAAAAVPVQLPPGEPASAWTEPLALAGLVPAAGGAAPAVVLTADGARWTIHVTTPDSVGRTVVVAAPTTLQAREDLAWLLASLLQPVGVRASAPAPVAALPRPVVPVQPAAPPRATASPAPAPSTAARAASPVAPPDVASTELAAASAPGGEPLAVLTDAPPPAEPPPELTDGAVVAPAAPEPVAEGAAVEPAASSPVVTTLSEPTVVAGSDGPAAPPLPAVAVWVEPTAGVRLVVGTSAAPDLGLAGGVRFAGGWRLGAAGGWEQATTLVELGEGRTVGGAWLAVEGGWEGETRVAPAVGVWLGGARRRYAEVGETVGDVFTPLAGGRAGGRLLVAPAIALVLEGTFRCDLRPTDLYAPAVATTVASPCGAGARVGVEISAPDLGGSRQPAARAAETTASRRRSTNPARGSGHQEGA